MTESEYPVASPSPHPDLVIRTPHPAHQTHNGKIGDEFRSNVVDSKPSDEDEAVITCRF